MILDVPGEQKTLAFPHRTTLSLTDPAGQKYPPEQFPEHEDVVNRMDVPYFPVGHAYLIPLAQ